MIRVITYGTFDLLHHGHIRLLARAKALGEYLIVGVTSEDFDMSRGKINVHQSLATRMEAVSALGIADEIIVEEYEGQKIDDILRYDIDIFTVGSDWAGKFDYLKEYCRVVYLDRTEGISSSAIRADKRMLRVGLVGEAGRCVKFAGECGFVNGVCLSGICTDKVSRARELFPEISLITKSYADILSNSDAVYITSHPSRHYAQAKQALEAGKHVLCELPVTLEAAKTRELYSLAKNKKCILMAAAKTAYATAYVRLLLLAKEGRIGQVVSIDATCTRLRKRIAEDTESLSDSLGSVFAWGPTALLPVFQILGDRYRDIHIVSRYEDNERKHDSFTKIDFLYDSSVAAVKVADGVKSEGELILSGTEGYLYVPAPWWKTDYFEIRYEDIKQNRRYFFQLDGEGIRHEIVAFVKAIETGRPSQNISKTVVENISRVMELFLGPGNRCVLPEKQIQNHSESPNGSKALSGKPICKAIQGRPGEE